MSVLTGLSSERVQIKDLSGCDVWSGYYPELGIQIIASSPDELSRTEMLRLQKLLPIRLPCQTEQFMAVIASPEYKAAVQRHLCGYDQKGEPMAQADSDTLAKRIDEQEGRHASVQSQLAQMQSSHDAQMAQLQQSFNSQIAELSKQQADSHAAILNALQSLSQPSPAASEPAKPTAQKE